MKAEAAHPGEATTSSEVIPQLPEAYYKARKQYGLFAALLLAWELVGFSVEEIPLEAVRLEIQNPEAVPYVVIALIAYFGIRLTLEWLQADRRRRANKVARFDFAFEHAIALLAVGVFGVQRALEIRIAESLPVVPVLGGFLFAASGYLLASYLGLLHRNRISLRQKKFVEKSIETTLEIRPVHVSSPWEYSIPYGILPLYRWQEIWWRVAFALFVLISALAWLVLEATPLRVLSCILASLFGASMKLLETWDLVLTSNRAVTKAVLEHLGVHKG